VFRRREQAFTMTELLVAMAIIAIMATFAVPQLNSLLAIARCLFRKFGASKTSCPRRRASSPPWPRLLDSRFRGNDASLQELAVYLRNGHLE